MLFLRRFSLFVLSPLIRAEAPLFGRRLWFAAGFLFALSTWASPALALALGIASALCLENPFRSLGRAWSGRLLRFGVVLLGFGMSLPTVLAVGRDGAWMAALTIAGPMALGLVIGGRLGVDARTSTLISAGTAVCGGSAIAAMATVIGAMEGQIAVALATVFLLNAAALYLFPWIGEALQMAPDAFGMWAGVAIHDLSSVVGAAALYGPESLQIATAVKLSRTLWIVPLAFVAAAWIRRASQDPDGVRPKIKAPFFILLFLLASLSRELVPAIESFVPTLQLTAKAALTGALFLIGAGISMAELRKVGRRPLIQGVVLWIFISSVSLSATLL